jgi:UDP-2-acetamido-2-deoxy-ribo-hexuluronate aminotransferase
VVRNDRTCVWAQFTLQSDDRADLLARLAQADIPTAIHYPVPLHQQPAYRDRCRISGSLANAERLGERVFSIPMHPYLDEATQARVVKVVKG